MKTSKSELGVRSCEISRGIIAPKRENRIVSNVKEKTIPNARATVEYLPSLAAAPKTNGKIGITQGERVDRIPATQERRIE
jgi:hypothetical protein